MSAYRKYAHASVERILDGRGQIAKDSVMAVLLKIANLFLGFMVTVALARMLGPDGLGVYALALAIIAIIGMPSQAGVPQLVTKETAKLKASEDWTYVKGLWRWSTTVVVLFCLFVLIITLSVGLFVKPELDQELMQTLLISLLLIPFMGLALVRSSSLRGLGYTIQGQLPELLIKPLIFLLVFLGLALVGAHQNLTASCAMAINVSACLGSFLVGVILLNRVKPKQLIGVKAFYKHRAWLLTIFPMAALNVMHLINTHVDILLIGLYMERADVGQYKVAAQISLLIAIGLQATKMVVEPHFARLFHQGDLVGLGSLARIASRISGLLAVAILAVFIVFGESLLKAFFGAAFLAAFAPMLILSLGRVVSSFFGTSGSVLVMSGYHTLYAKYWIMSAALNVALNVILIPLFGLKGAAVATSSTLVIPHILGWWAVRTRVGCDCSAFARSF